MNRHHLIYLRPEDAFIFLDASLILPVQQKIRHMMQQNMPFTICRQESKDYFKVATNCLINGRKYRVALGLAWVPASSQKPLHLSAITETFDTQTKSILHQFIQQMEKLNCSVYVYGSYACQHLYQEKFVHAQSDLDLLIESSNMEMIAEIIQAIDQLKKQLAIAIDGEIALPTTQNISFNELIFALKHTQKSIIVKELYEISLQNIAEIFGAKLDALQQDLNCPT